MSNRIELPDPIAALRHDAINAAIDAGYTYRPIPGATMGVEHLRSQPGKFEGEPWYLPYFYQLALDGVADSDALYAGEHCDADVFTLSPLERAAFDLPDEADILLVCYSESGFVSCRTMSAAQFEKLAAQYDADNAEDCDNDNQN